jgi:cytoskeletal protein RodZ
MAVGSLSSELQDRRKLFGLSREEASRKFRIPLAFIVAVEECLLDELPAPVYARGFLRSYCEGLGLAPDPRLDALNEVLHRRGRFRVTFLGERPKWLDDAMMWAAIALVLAIGWIAYSAVVKPGEDTYESGVHAETVELDREDPFSAP